MGEETPETPEQGTVNILKRTWAEHSEHYKQNHAHFRVWASPSRCEPGLSKCGLWPPPTEPSRAVFQHSCWERLPLWVHSSPSMVVYFSLDLRFLDNSTRFTLSQAPISWFNSNFQSGDVFWEGFGFSDHRWRVWWNGQNSILCFLRMFKPLTITVQSLTGVHTIIVYILLLLFVLESKRRKEGTRCFVLL